MRIHSFLLNFAQKRNKIIQQWTLENLFERLKATIMRNDFLRTIIIIGLIAFGLSDKFYTVGKMYRQNSFANDISIIVNIEKINMIMTDKKI